MSRFALVVCAVVCASLALANVAFWHVEGWMPLGASAALAFVFAVTERVRERTRLAHLHRARRQAGERTRDDVWSAFDDCETDEPLEPRFALAEPALRAEDVSR